MPSRQAKRVPSALAEACGRTAGLTINTIVLTPEAEDFHAH
jgi:hypothetical protein